jgi:hypothetical protein
MTAENSLYFILVYMRWVEPEGWGHSYNTFFKGIPFWIRWFVAWFQARKVREMLWNQGIGRHSTEAVLRFAEKDLDALENMYASVHSTPRHNVKDQSAETRWFLGKPKPTLVDLTVFPLLAAIFFSKWDSPLRRLALTKRRLLEYCVPILLRYFPEKSQEALALV